MCVKSNFNLLFSIGFHLHFNENVAFFLKSALSARTLCHHGNTLCSCSDKADGELKMVTLVSSY